MCAVGAILTRVPPLGTGSPTFPEGTESIGETIRDLAYHSWNSLGPFIQSDVVLQLCRRHLDVPDIPKHPPDQAEENDDSSRVDQKVVEEDIPKHSRQEDQESQYIMKYSKPKRALAPTHSLTTFLHGVTLSFSPKRFCFLQYQVNMWHRC